MTEALYTHNAYNILYGCRREKVQTLSTRMGFEIGSGAAHLSEMQIPVLEPGKESEKVMPPPKDPIKYAEFCQKIREANLRNGNVPPSRKGIKDTPETRKKKVHTGESNHFYGKHHTEQAIEKNREKHIGRHLSIEARLAITGDKNPTKRPEVRAKMGSPGPSHPNWKGGASFEPYCPKFNREFKRRVRAFFGYKCAECGAPENGRKHAVHHVNFNKKVCCDGTVPLFVPLCCSCHGKTQFNRDYWQEHFTEMITAKYDGKCYFTRDEMTK